MPETSVPNIPYIELYEKNSKRAGLHKADNVVKKTWKDYGED